MQDIKIKVITYNCPNNNFPVIFPPHLQPLSRERDCFCENYPPRRKHFHHVAIFRVAICFSFYRSFYQLKFQIVSLRSNHNISAENYLAHPASHTRPGALSLLMLLLSHKLTGGGRYQNGVPTNSNTKSTYEGLQCTDWR